MTLVPRSDLRTLEGPRMAKNLLKALIKLEVDMDSITSICTARVPRHVNNTAHRLFSAVPPPVRHDTTLHGPKTSRPTLVNGGSMESLSSGKSDIFCS